MLGEDRGPVLEVIVSRTNFISSHTSQKVRVVGLSTALANARDLADWLGINQVGDAVGWVGKRTCCGDWRKGKEDEEGCGSEGRGGVEKSFALLCHFLPLKCPLSFSSSSFSSSSSSL